MLESCILVSLVFYTARNLDTCYASLLFAKSVDSREGRGKKIAGIIQDEHRSDAVALLFTLIIRASYLPNRLPSKKKEQRKLAKLCKINIDQVEKVKLTGLDSHQGHKEEDHDKYVSLLVFWLSGYFMVKQKGSTMT